MTETDFHLMKNKLEEVEQKEEKDEDVGFTVFYYFTIEREQFLKHYLNNEQCLRCGAICKKIHGTRLIISFPNILCCKCFAEVFGLEKDNWCYDCKRRKAIEELYEKLHRRIRTFHLGQIDLVSEAISRAYRHDFFTASEGEANSLWEDMAFLLEQNSSLVGKELLEQFTHLLEEDFLPIKIGWAEMKTHDFIRRIRNLVRSHLQAKERLKREARPENRFYYDLIELPWGHVPVSFIHPFWRWFFRTFAPKKTRDKEFFKCPFCGKGSFYSQWTNGCDYCSQFLGYDFIKRYPECYSSGDEAKLKDQLLKKRAKRERRQALKNFLLKTGLWVFFVKAYVISFQTKRKCSRERVEKFIKTGEVE